MFDNEKRAEEAGKAYEQELLARGTHPQKAAAARHTEEFGTLATLEEWTKQNVGLD